MKLLVPTVLTLLISSVIFLGCRKDNFTTDPSVKLRFSADTVLFDTVFTTIGSTTAALKVYNDFDQKVNITSIQLQSGSGSFYRINVDGVNGASHSDIEIGGGDSLWIFVEVTLDPNGLNQPFIIEDNIHFVTNGNEQVVNLAAWGRDAHFHGSLNNLDVLPCDEVWSNDKPHVIYGIVAVDSACCLTINPGTEVFCHAGGGILVYKSKIIVDGELGSEVVFQGDRLEPYYQDLAGQWGIELTFAFETGFGVEYATVTRGGLWLYESTGSSIDYAIIKNGIIGIQVDTAHTATDALAITNTKVLNMSAIGLLSQGGSISGHNNLIANCGQACGAFTLGGRYDISQTSFVNYWTQSNRQSPTFILNNYYESTAGDLIVRPFESATFRNCIMHGNNAQLSDFSEFIIDLEDEENAIYEFSSCYVDSDLNFNDDAHYSNMKKGANGPPFLDPFNGDFDWPVSISNLFTGPLVGGISTDIEGVNRFGSTGLGCYEFGE
jgi:hypothetical protein